METNNRNTPRNIVLAYTALKANKWTWEEMVRAMASLFDARVDKFAMSAICDAELRRRFANKSWSQYKFTENSADTLDVLKIVGAHFKALGITENLEGSAPKVIAK